MRNGFILGFFLVCLCFSQNVYSESSPGKYAYPPTVIAHYDDRLAQLEDEIKTLRGTIEVLQHELDQIKTSQKNTSASPAQETNKTHVVEKPKTTEVSETKSTPVAETKPEEKKSSPKIDYQNARSLLLKSDYQKAAVKLNEFITNYPSHELTGNAYYWLGETYYVQNKYKDATTVFAKGYKLFPNSQKAPALLLKLGLSLKALKRQKDACNIFTQIGQRHPKSPKNILKYAEKQKSLLKCPKL